MRIFNTIYLALVLASSSLAACGAASTMQQQAAAAEAANGAGTGSQTTATTTSTQTTAPAAPLTQPSTTVQVSTTTTVSVSAGGAAAAPGAAHAPASTLLLFADAAFGWFFADGSFDHGAAYVNGQEAPAYCRFAAPGCEGSCIVDSLPVKDSLFTNGASYFKAIETETDLGQVVVSSVWQQGSCQASVKTLQHSYEPKTAWVLDAGDSTVPSQHNAQ